MDRNEWGSGYQKEYKVQLADGLTSLRSSTNYPVVAESHLVKQVFWLVPSTAPSRSYNQWQRVRQTPMGLTAASTAPDSHRYSLLIPVGGTPTETQLPQR